jgi:hypothetical protein
VNRYLADLHIHTALSPCAAEEMTPPAIVRAARERGLAMIAVCDHNSAGNAGAVQEAAAGRPAVIAGMEITTAEEVHVLGLFPDTETARRAGEQVRSTLPEKGGPARAGTPEGAVKARIWGEQPLLDARGRRVGVESRMLAVASGFTLAECVRLIHGHRGVAVAAHLDRPSFSVVSQLGFIPEGMDFDALEISAAGARRGQARELEARGFRLVSSSDSHFLEAVGCACARLEMRALTFVELAMALRGQEGRRCGVA